MKLSEEYLRAIIFAIVGFCVGLLVGSMASHDDPQPKQQQRETK